MTKIKRTWAMPVKNKGIGNNLAGARIVSTGERFTDSRGVAYHRKETGQITRLTEKK